MSNLYGDFIYKSRVANALFCLSKVSRYSSQTSTRRSYINSSYRILVSDEHQKEIDDYFLLCFSVVELRFAFIHSFSPREIVMRIASFLVKKKASKFFETLLFIFVKITHTKPHLLLLK